MKVNGNNRPPTLVHVPISCVMTTPSAGVISLKKCYGKRFIPQSPSRSVTESVRFSPSISDAAFSRFHAIRITPAPSAARNNESRNLKAMKLALKQSRFVKHTNNIYVCTKQLENNVKVFYERHDAVLQSDHNQN